MMRMAQTGMAAEQWPAELAGRGVGKHEGLVVTASGQGDGKVFVEMI